MINGYEKGMSVTELEKIADENCSRFKEMEIYLNEKGIAAYESHHVIANACVFSASCEELKHNLEEEIKESKNEKVISNLSYFIKNYL